MRVSYFGGTAFLNQMKAFMGYTIHVVCKMTRRGDCGDA